MSFQFLTGVRLTPVLHLPPPQPENSGDAYDELTFRFDSRLHVMRLGSRLGGSGISLCVTYFRSVCRGEWGKLAVFF